MKNSNKGKAAFLALLLALGGTSSALAIDEYGIGKNDPSSSDMSKSTYTSESGATEASGGTTVGVVAVRKENVQISFTVPLYATLAVVGNASDSNATVYAPAMANYKITNTSDDEKVSIGVTKATVEGVGASLNDAENWSIKQNVGSDPRALKLNLSNTTTGGVPVPDISRSSTTPVAIENLWTAPNSPFGANNKGTLIAKNASIPIQFVGSVMSGWRDNANTVDIAATPMWKFKYTLARIDVSGKQIVAFTYSGNTEHYVWDGTRMTTQGAFK